MHISTERLLLRPHTTEDWFAVYAYANHPDVLRYRPDDVRTAAAMQEHLQQLVAAQHQHPRTRYHFAIVLHANTRVIGWCGLALNDATHRIAELGYDLDRAEWGNGYMTEAARAVVAFGFTSLGLHRIVAACHPQNSASRRVMEKIGMTYEGHLRENVWVKGTWWDTLVYGLLERDWPGDAGGARLA